MINIVTVLPSISNVKFNFVSSVLPGSYSTIDTTNDPGLDSRETLGFDANYHQETIHIPSVDRNSIPRLNPRFTPSSSLYIASPVNDISAKPILISRIQFELSLFVKPSPSSLDAIPFSYHIPNGRRSDIK